LFFLRYTSDVITRFGNDSRVAIWDLYNEPSGSPLVLQLLEQVYTTAVRANPQQPLTSAPFTTDLSGAIPQFQINSSDIITFHNYAPLSGTMENIVALRQFNRPLICSEYMARSAGSTFHTHTKYYHAEKIGAINWGLVAGKTQTYFPWGSKPNTPIPLVWFHDIFNNTGEPYSPYEIQFFKDLKLERPS